MLKEIKKSLVKNLLPKRNPKSHKGQNGKVLIIGGSIDFHGAPILSALGALYSGADLVYIYVPECNFECTRGMYPDFIVKKYAGEFLTEAHAEEIIKFGRDCDSLVIGPGLGERESTIKAVGEIVKNLHIPTVIDADALMILKKIEKFPLPQSIVITPHQNEFHNLIERDILVDKDDPKSIVILRSIAMDLHISVLLKGPIDYVSSEEGMVELNFTGNAGMTVGGTGDVLAGMVGTFLAQGMEAFDAARSAAFINGVAGDILYKQKGPHFSATELAMTLPYALL